MLANVLNRLSTIVVVWMGEREEEDGDDDDDGITEKKRREKKKKEEKRKKKKKRKQKESRSLVKSRTHLRCDGQSLSHRGRPREHARNSTHTQHDQLSRQHQLLFFQKMKREKQPIFHTRRHSFNCRRFSGLFSFFELTSGHVSFFSLYLHTSPLQWLLHFVRACVD